MGQSRNQMNSVSVCYLKIDLSLNNLLFVWLVESNRVSHTFQNLGCKFLRSRSNIPCQANVKFSLTDKSLTKREINRQSVSQPFNQFK